MRTKIRRRPFLDALASLDFKFSVSESVMFFKLAHLRVFQSYFNIKCGWLVIIIYLGGAGDQGGDSGRGLAEPGPSLPAGDEPSQPGQDPSMCNYKI